MIKNNIATALERNQHRTQISWLPTLLGVYWEYVERLCFLLQCCPGYVDTDMTGHKGTKTLDDGKNLKITAKTTSSKNVCPCL